MTRHNAEGRPVCRSSKFALRIRPKSRHVQHVQGRFSTPGDADPSVPLRRSEPASSTLAHSRQGSVAGTGSRCCYDGARAARSARRQSSSSPVPVLAAGLTCGTTRTWQNGGATKLLSWTVPGFIASRPTRGTLPALRHPHAAPRPSRGQVVTNRRESGANGHKSRKFRAVGPRRTVDTDGVVTVAASSGHDLSSLSIP